MKWIKRLAYLLLILYGVFCAIIFFQQERMIFQPTKLPADFSFWKGEEVYIPVDGNVKLHGLWLKQRKSRGVILYWHGNRGSNRRCLRQAENLYGLGYDVFMPDYRSYGKSGGEIDSEEQLFSDAQHAYDWLKKYFQEDQIVLVGYSLGSSMATYLAKENNPQHLVLVSPFQSMVAMKNLFLPVAPSFLMKYPFYNDRHLSEVKCSISLFHGTADELIPFAQSEYLQNLNPDQVQLTPLNGTGHRGAIFSKQIRTALSSIFNQGTARK